MDNYLTLEKSAEYLQVYPDTLRRWVRQKKVQCYRIGPNVLRFKREDLDEIMKVVPSEPPEINGITTQ